VGPLLRSVRGSAGEKGRSRGGPPSLLEAASRARSRRAMSGKATKEEIIQQVKQVRARRAETPPAGAATDRGPCRDRARGRGEEEARGPASALCRSVPGAERGACGGVR
jgi:hypothetical protein